MRMIRCAILAVVVATFAQVAAQTVSPPIAVNFQLADGIRIRGQLTAWDADGFDGSFGRRQWVALMPDDTWDLHHRIMDRRAAQQWVNLGRVLLLMPHESTRANVLAERAFRAALREDPDTQNAIDDARKEATAAAQARRSAQKARAEKPLDTAHPESTDWPANPWPSLNDEEVKAAILTMRAASVERLERAGIDLSPMETEHFLMYFDTPRPEAARWILVLERARDTLRRTLNMANQTQTEWGKIAVFIVSKRADFQKIEEKSFEQLVPLATTGMCHCTGPQVFIVVERDADEDLISATLIHQTVLGLMHHVGTPHRLPPWANAGLAEHIASLELPTSLALQERRRAALQYIRDGGDVHAVLNSTYDQITTPKARDIHLGLGRLMTELMISDRPDRYVRWVAAVKAGNDWSDSLRNDFGVSRDQLVQTAVRFYMVND
jgi:hypothetical protein